MNQFRIFLRLDRRSILSWAIGFAAWMLLMGGSYAAVGGDDSMEGLWENYPEKIKEVIGVEDLASVEGFLQAEVGSFFPLVFGIFLIMYMTKHLAGAEESGRLDHALARPVTRSRYYWHAVLAGVAVYGIILVAGLAGGLTGFAVNADGKELAGIAGMMAEFLLFGTTFIGIGALVGAAFHRRGAANGVGAGIAVAFFALTLVARLVEQADWLVWLTPMGYLERSDLFHGDLDWVFVVFSLALAAATAIGGWWVFERKNLYA